MKRNEPFFIGGEPEKKRRLGITHWGCCRWRGNQWISNKQMIYVARGI